MRPFVLRRMKADVEKSVPPKEETVVHVELTAVQKQWCRAIDTHDCVTPQTPHTPHLTPHISLCRRRATAPTSLSV